MNVNATITEVASENTKLRMENENFRQNYISVNEYKSLLEEVTRLKVKITRLHDENERLRNLIADKNEEEYE